MAACFISAPVLSLPLNPTVVNGSATFNQAGNVLTVTNSNGAIINWNKFSIQAGETTHFAQTSASSTVLNRVLNDPTAIYGTLSSNGRVWLVNPAGIMVGPGGKVDVAGFVASTLNISNADFLAGRNVFINDGSAGNVINQGEIRTPAGGSVYLIGSNVSNEGIITTPKGETILAAGATVSLIDSATPGVKVDITGAEGNATNLGTLTAEAGRIGIAGVIVRNSGTVNASSVVSEGGRVFLKASQDAYVDGNGRIVTTGTKGGSVEVLGNRVAVMDNAEIDVSGVNGGGKILVGGDYQGKNPDIQNANVSYFGPNASLKADAGKVGDGGTVIVWADDTTRAYGNISARGGAIGGNGGFVETSGKSYLAVDGINVDTRAPQGKTGTWLLDPSEIFIYGGAPNTAVTTTVNSNPIGILTTEFTTGAAYGSSTISDTTINTMLDTTDVIIHTAGGTGGNGNINVTNANISKPVGGMALTLAAYGGGTATGNIIITNSNINVRDGVTLLAGWTGVMPPYGADGNTLSSVDVINGKGDITIAGSMIQSSEWAVNLWAGKDITLTNSGIKGTLIQGATMEVKAGNNLTLLSTYGGTISSPQGPGVLLEVYGGGQQTIKAGNQILLQAGSADNTLYGGNNMATAGVGIFSDGDQTISAKTIKLYAGAGGHDNSAGFQAYGSQTINIGDSGGGSLEVYGGGISGSGTYNNQARIQHGRYDNYGGNVVSGTGVQTITIYGGGTVSLVAGSGDGTLGYYDFNCGIACSGHSSNNSAQIESLVGSQALAFPSGGSLTLTGGSAGTSNWAGISNKGTRQDITGYANITLNGGSGGGSSVLYGGENFDQSNDAGIYSKGSGGQYITAGTLTINGGNADYGGAGISNEGMTLQPLQIVTSGNMSMYGGTSNVSLPYAAAVYIHSEAGGPIILNVGGNLHVQAGGPSAPAIIGSIDGLANVSVTASNITLKGTGYGGVWIGSVLGLGAASLAATGNITVDGPLTTVRTFGTAISLNAGNDVLGGGNIDTSPSVYGANAGNLNAGSITVTGKNITLGDLTGNGFSGRNGQDGSSGEGDGTDGQDGGNGATISITGTSITVNTIYANGGRGGYGGDGVDAGDGGTSAGKGGRGGKGGNGGNVSLTATSGTVSLGAVDARGNSGGNGGNGGNGGSGSPTGGKGGNGGDGGQGGNVTLTATGNISVAGDVDARGGRGRGGDCCSFGSGHRGAGGDASSSGSAGNGGDGGVGGSGGTVRMTAGGSIHITGAISAYGSDGGRGGGGGGGSSASVGGRGGIGGNGGAAGNVFLTAGSAAGDAISVYGGIYAGGGGGASGGAGGGTSGGYGGIGGLTGGDGGAGGAGRVGGTVQLTASAGGVVVNNQIDLDGGEGGGGGRGGNGIGPGSRGGNGADNGTAGDGGNLTITAGFAGPGAITINNSIRVGGGDGGTHAGRGGDGADFGGDAGNGAAGGNGGSVSLTATSGGIAVRDIYAGGASGGDASSGGGRPSFTRVGGNAGSGGPGGKGGTVSLSAATGIVIGYGIQTNGGAGGHTDGPGYGSSVTGIFGEGGLAGNGGSVILNTGGSISIGLAAGGICGGSGCYRGIAANGGYANEGQTGGNGGTISLNALGSISGGSGGIVANGGYTTGPNGNGGNGGNGGTISLTATSGTIQVSGEILADGAEGGYGYNGYNGGNGGNGGQITLTAALIDDTVAAWISASGGQGGNGGWGGGSSGAGVGGNGGTGGVGGIVSLTGTSGITLTGGARGGSSYGGPVVFAMGPSSGGSSKINARGGRGGRGGNGDSSGNGSGTVYFGVGGNGGNGGNGGAVSLSAPAGNVSLTGGPLSIDTRGGPAGAYGLGSVNGIAGVGGFNGSTIISAGGNIDVGEVSRSVGSLGLAAGGTLRLNGNIDIDGSLVLSGANVVADAPIDVGATLNTFVSAGTLNLSNGAGIYAGYNLLVNTSGEINLSNGGWLTGNEVSLLGSGINANYGGGVYAYNNITAEVLGNIKLDNGSYFEAGDDIKLRLAGNNSEVSLSNGSYMLADSVTQQRATIFLDFLTRSSGGIMIDGTATTTSLPDGSGFFVMNTSTPATTSPGGGLVITYANSNVIDPCATSPDLCKPPIATDTPLFDVVEADPCTAAPDSAQCKAPKQEKDREEKDQFGDDDGKKDGKSSQKKVAQCGI